MTRTKRGKGRPKKQSKRKPSSKASEESRALKGGLVTSRAWISIKRKNWKILIDYDDTDVPNRLSFFGLPAEIRNQIYGYLFPPRKVDIKESKYDSSNFIPQNSSAWSLVLQAISVSRIKVSTNLNPGLAFLSTCRRAYEECRLHYYSNTIFFLAPGKVTNTINLAKVVQLANLELITSIGIRFDAADFGPKEYRSLSRLFGGQIATGLSRFAPNRSWRITRELLRAVWHNKLRWIYRHSWRSLRVIHLENLHRGIIISVNAFLRRCSLADFAPSPGHPRDPELRAFLTEASQAATIALMNRVDELRR